MADDGVTVTPLTGGGLWGCPAEGADLLPPHPVKNAGMARMAKKKRLRCKGNLPGVNELLPYTKLVAEPQAGGGSVSKLGLGK
jgi:hypothetical protein